MNETPTTEQVRAEWVRGMVPGVPVLVDRADLAFARWLAAERAAVWDEAIDAARTVIGRGKGTYEADIDLLTLPNPYREESC